MVIEFAFPLAIPIPFGILNLQTLDHPGENRGDRPSESESEGGNRHRNKDQHDGVLKRRHARLDTPSSRECKSLLLE